MNLLKLAFGLIREAAATPVGRDVINNMRPSARQDVGPEPGIDVEMLLAEHRAQVSQSLEAVLEKMNRQNARLAEAIRRQRVWNLALAAGLIMTFIAAMVAVWNSGWG